MSSHFSLSNSITVFPFLLSPLEVIPNMHSEALEPYKHPRGAGKKNEI